MRCLGQGSELLIGYCAGTLPPETELAVTRHLTGCARCERLAKEQRTLWLAMDAWESAPVSRDFDERLFARVAAEEARPWYSRLLEFNWNWRPAMPVAAAGAALIAVFLFNTPAIEETPVPSFSVQKKVDIEQVERALDDIDMLRQMGALSQAAQVGSAHDRM